MPGLVIKDLPPDLHRRLKEEAARNHRSMTKQVLVFLENALRQSAVSMEPPPPFKGRFELNEEFLERAKREGRE